MKTKTPSLLALLNLSTILLSFLFLPAIYSQERIYPFDIITKDETLIGTPASFSMEDSDGFMWFGIRDKFLVKYDGYSFSKQDFIPDSLIKKDLICSNMLEVSPGVFWIGSKDGLLIYDKQTKQVKKYDHPALREKNIDLRRINRLLKDSHDRIWMATSKGLIRLKTNKAPIAYQLSQNHKDKTLFFRSLSEDKAGNIWGGTAQGLVKIDTSNHSMEIIPATKDLHLISIQAAAEGIVWLGTLKKGLWKWSSKDKLLTNIDLPDPANRRDVRDIAEDEQGNLWVAISPLGIFKLDKSGDYQGLHFKHDPYDPFSLLSNRIINLYFDSHKNLWIMSMKGVSKINFSELIFPFYQHFKGWFHDQNSIYGSLFQDSQGGIWYDNAQVGHSYSEGLGKKARHFGPDEQICINQNTCFYAEYQQSVWVLCRGNSIQSVDIESKQATTLDLGDSLSAREVEYFTNDLLDKDIIWFSGQYGLCRYNARTQRKEWFYPKDDLPELLNNRLIVFFSTKDQKFWMGTSDEHGLKIIFFDKELKQFGTFSNQAYRKFLPDKLLEISGILAVDQKLWIGTPKGLIEINLSNEQALLHDTSDFLPEDPIIFLTSDQQQNLWIATNHYITHYSSRQDSLLGNFYVADLIGSFNPVLNHTPLPHTQNGEIIFPGTNGMVAFNPEMIKKDTTRPSIVLTDFRVLNKSREFDMAIEKVKEIDVYHGDKSITFELAALHYASPQKNRYQYQLKGWDDDWVDMGFERNITFTNLSQGTYTFRARGANANGIWNLPKDDLIIHLRVHPPWFRSVWAYGLYALLFFGALYFAYHFQLTRKLEMAEAQRLQELDQFKTHFFTNITHEFRTPLTIILGMAKKISHAPGEWLSQGTTMIERSGQNLLRLVNQMLDLSKLESGKLSLEMINGDILPFFHYAIDSFRSYAATKNIKIHYLAEEDKVVMDYDPDKLLTVISNLFSNAIKFTPEGGDIYLSLRKSSNTSEEKLLFIIRDTGVGIPKDELPHIFDRFYQVDGSATRQGEGTGIGLALSQEMIQLMGGHIQVKSKINEGTSFQVELPITTEAAFQEFAHPDNQDWNESLGGIVSPANHDYQHLSSQMDLPIVLIIEDNKDVVTFMVACLKAHYQILVAYNGRKGIDKATDQIPDVVICDVMMPEKDGYEVCFTLKNDERTSHIPIVLLTAKADQESRLEGLRQGADAYLLKPFNEEELIIRLEKLIELRRALHKRYAAFPLLDIRQQGLPIEDDFLMKIRDVIDQNLSDADFNLAKLCRAMQMSRSQIYRKLKALTGKSTTHVIRTYRLHKGMELLKNTDMNISEVAYEVGFTSLSYFTRSFKEEFGVAPRDWKE